jgi:hypothetical protein
MRNAVIRTLWVITSGESANETTKPVSSDIKETSFLGFATTGVASSPLLGLLWEQQRLSLDLERWSVDLSYWDSCQEVSALPVAWRIFRHVLELVVIATAQRAPEP